MPRPPLTPGEWGEINTGGTTAAGKVRARARYCTVGGKVVSIEAVGKTAAEAKRRLKRRMDEWQPDRAATRFRDVAQMWLDDLRAHNEVRAQSADNYERTLRTTLNPLLGGRAVGGLTAPEVQAALDEIHRTKPGMYSPAVTVARGVFGYAVMRGLTDTNPAISIHRRKVTTKQIRALELDELAGLRGMVRQWQAGPRRTQPLLDVVDLALSTGARIGELLALTWEDVDLNARTLTLTGTQVWQRGRGIVHQTVTKERTRLRLPLTDFAMAMLAHRRHRNPSARYVFASRTGGMISRANLDRAWRAARGDQFQWVTWHTFRKSVATLAAEATDAATAARILGHTSDSTTRKHYIASNSTAVPDITAVLEALAGDKVISFDDAEIEPGDK